MQNNQSNQEEAFDWSSYEGGRYNTSVKLTDADKKAGVKIYCKEPYAQELYDKMSRLTGGTSQHESYNKDMSEGEICKVVAKTINFNNSYIVTEHTGSSMPVIVPFKEYSGDLNDLAEGKGLEFYVMISRSDGYGELYASERRCKAQVYKQDIVDHYEKDTWFDVKITSLIKGGYVATYKDQIECFIPGSHAGANVIHDFNEKLGMTIPVMVDNYDKGNDLFILSYKKYVRESMPIMIGNVQFGKKYVGRLTNKPYDFGAFIEFEDYYTGLLHSSEFENFDEFRKMAVPGQEVEFYVKDVTQKLNKKGQSTHRIVLTLNEKSINEEKLAWQNIKNLAEGKEFEFTRNSDHSNIEILIDGLPYEIGIKRSMQGKIDFSRYKKIKINKVDHINKNFKFEFLQ